MFIKYIILFILQLTILELFEAIDFEGKFEKLSYFDHLYLAMDLAMEGGTYSFVESWMLFSCIIKFLFHNWHYLWYVFFILSPKFSKEKKMEISCY